MKNETELLAEVISTIQYIQILLLRTDLDKHPPAHERAITNKELWKIVKNLVPPMKDLSEELQNVVICKRKEMYDIV